MKRSPARGQQRVTRHHHQQGIILCDFITLQFVLAGWHLVYEDVGALVIGHQLAAMLMLLKCEALSPAPSPASGLLGDLPGARVRVTDMCSAWCQPTTARHKDCTPHRPNSMSPIRPILSCWSSVTLLTGLMVSTLAPICVKFGKKLSSVQPDVVMLTCG